MLATGMIRRVDELGRIVIPKELRKTLNIQEGEQLEIYTNNIGELILKKYSFLRNKQEDLKIVAKILSNYIDKSLLICNTDIVIAGKKNLRELAGQALTLDFINYIYKKSSKLFGYNQIPITQYDNIKMKKEYIQPICFEGDVIGAIVIKSDEITEKDMDLCEFATKVIETGIKV